MFALRERRHTVEEVATLLDVDYIVDGLFERRGNRVIVRVELTEARTARIVWAEVFDHNAAETLILLGKWEQDCSFDRSRS